MLDGATLLRIEVFQARPQPQAFRIERPPPAGLDSARTERELNHDSPFVRNVIQVRSWGGAILPARTGLS